MTGDLNFDQRANGHEQHEEQDNASIAIAEGHYAMPIELCIAERLDKSRLPSGTDCLLDKFISRFGWIETRSFRRT
jgi:hypothetical protein